MERFVLKTSQLTDNLQMGEGEVTSFFMLDIFMLTACSIHVFSVRTECPTNQISICCWMSMFWNILGPAENKYLSKSFYIHNVLCHANQLLDQSLSY